MSLVCGLSGEVPEQPVVSPVSGGIFEKRLVEKYVEEYGTDPQNGQPLSKDQLIEVKAPKFVRPKLPTLAGVPGLLKTLQDEWDAIMLYNHSLKQQLQATRQELSHALYQHDAACRVIARLQKELNAAREALATLKPQVVMSNGRGDHMDEVEEPMTIPEEVLKKVIDKNNQLTTVRKQRGKAVPQGLATVEQIKAFHEVHSVPSLHSASLAGITCIDIQIGNYEHIVTGGNDHLVSVYDRKSETVLASLKGHTKKINRVAFVPNRDIVLSASDDHTFRAWSVEKASSLHTFKIHQAPVTSVSLHPVSDYILSSSRDMTWAFSDLNNGKTYRIQLDAEEAEYRPQSGVTSAQFHPDGIILGAGTAKGAIRIWDIREGIVANFQEHAGEVVNMSFSENGYHLFSAVRDVSQSSVQVWDLRKLVKTIKIIELPEKYEINDVVVDHSAKYLAVAGKDLRVYLCKEWNELTVIQEHTKDVTGVRFGPNASFLVSSSLDRTVKYFQA